MFDALSFIGGFCLFGPVIGLILAISGYFGAQKALPAIELSRRQAKSVLSRYRNKATLALWNDLTDIRIAGLLPVGENLLDLFPDTVAELEAQRTKNPEAWANTIAFLAPILLRVKANAMTDPGKMLKRLLGGFTQGSAGAGTPNPGAPAQTNNTTNQT